MEPVATLADVLVFLGETQPGALRGVLQQFPDLEETYGKADNMWERRSRALRRVFERRREFSQSVALRCAFRLWFAQVVVVVSVGRVQREASKVRSAASAVARVRSEDAAAAAARVAEFNALKQTCAFRRWRQIIVEVKHATYVKEMQREELERADEVDRLIVKVQELTASRISQQREEELARERRKQGDAALQAAIAEAFREVREPLPTTWVAPKDEEGARVSGSVDDVDMGSLGDPERLLEALSSLSG